MSITISNGGVAGITVETDPTALKLTGGTLSGTLFLPTARNLLNTDLNLVAYNDTGAGTTYTHSFKPFDGTFQLAPNGGGLRFPNGTVQTTAGLPLTGGTLSGKVNLAPLSAESASLNLGIGTLPTTTVAGDIWIGTNINFKDNAGTQKSVANTNTANTFNTNQVIAAASTGALLRITQTGTGNALVVEDTNNPDTTPFVIDANGKVGIGVAPDANACLRVDYNGIKFADGSTQTVSYSVTNQQYLADSIWLAHNFRFSSLSGSYDIVTGRTTITYSNSVAEALINNYSTDIEIVSGGTGYPISVINSGSIEFNVDLIGVPLLLRMRGITLTGGEFTL